MHDPHEPHLTVMKRILRYLQGILTTACFFVVPLRRTLSSTPMFTGSVVLTLTGPLRATRCS
jgi:hypothetical protein